MTEDDGLVVGTTEGECGLFGNGPDGVIYNPKNGRSYHFTNGFLGDPKREAWARDLISREKV